MSFSTLDFRREERYFFTLKGALDQLGDVVVGILYHLLAGLVRISSGGSGKKQAKEIVEFRNGANGRPR
jgi:hypothetical protein